MTCTPWFPGSERPVRVGIYERRGIWLHQFGSENKEANGFAYWDGVHWGISRPSGRLAVTTQGSMSGYQPRPFNIAECFEWRGLLKDTKP